MTKLHSIIQPEVGFFCDSVCPVCFKWLNTELCKCGHQLTKSLIVPYNFNWDYTESLEELFLNYKGLRLLAKYQGKSPEKLNKLSHCEYLYLSRYKGFELAFLNEFKDLKELSLDFITIDSLKGIDSLKKLVSLNLIELRKLTSLDGIEKLTNLKLLNVSICNKVKDLAALKKLLKLEYLSIESKSLENIHDLEVMSLKHLNFANESKIKDKSIEVLLRLKKLETLSCKKRLFRKADIEHLQTVNPKLKLTLR